MIERVSFSRLLESLICAPVFKNVGQSLIQKPIPLLVFFLLLVKSLKNLLIIILLAYWFSPQSLMEVPVKFLVLFFHFSITDGFKRFWMKNFHKCSLLMLLFLKISFLALFFHYYTLMIFLMILVVILPSMLMILLYSKCDWASDLWERLELAFDFDLSYQILWIGLRSCWLISVL